LWSAGVARAATATGPREDDEDGKWKNTSGVVAHSRCAIGVERGQFLYTDQVGGYRAPHTPARGMGRPGRPISRLFLLSVFSIFRFFFFFLFFSVYFLFVKI
jgi:hypothetical protein